MLAVLTGIFFVSVADFPWYWLVLAIPLFDLSAVGYLYNNRVGALLYNIGHSIIGPSLLAGVYIATSNQTVLMIATMWLFHIFFDRALGFGLKHSTGFRHTHLGHIGKAKKK